MKIGICSSALKVSGGMERYATDLVRGLSGAGIRPTFFARKFDPSLTEYSLVDPCLISTKWIPQRLRDNYFSYRLEKKKAELKVDALISCCRVSSSDIAVCGGTHLGWLRAMGKSAGVFDRSQIKLEQDQYSHSRHIIAHSKLLADELRDDYGIAPEKVSLLYPPIDSDKFRPASPAHRQELRRRFDFPDDRAVFLFPSSSHVRKGFPQLASFFGKTSLPVILAVAGRPIKSSSPNIRYLGFRKDVEECYQAADFTILASRYEPFGLVALESVLCGTPVVMPEDIGCIELLSDASKVMFDADDPASLAHAIDVALRNASQMRDRLGSPREHINEDIDMASHVKRVLTLCEGTI